MKKRLLPLGFFFSILLIATVTVNATSTISPGSFKFNNFDVPNAVVLSVEAINNFGATVGFFSNSAGATKGFIRFPNGVIGKPIVNPDDQGGDQSGATFATTINDSGVIGGYNFNSNAGFFKAFLLVGNQFVPFVAPGQPQKSNTTIFGLNNFGDFSGYIEDAPNYNTQIGYIEHLGRISPPVDVHRSDFSPVYALNNIGWSAGSFEDDATQTFHGYVRDSHGNITIADVPGASIMPNQGTVILGINDLGLVSGHFWDSAGNEHGFVGLPGARFFQIDVPGATSTSGGGLNDLGQVVGHWTDTSGVQHGYIATPNLKGE